MIILLIVLLSNMEDFVYYMQFILGGVDSDTDADTDVDVSTNNITVQK